MSKLAVVLSALACAFALTALVLQLTERDLSDRIVFTHNASPSDAVDDKEARAECPRGSMLIGGGEAVPHGHETPSVAVYHGLPLGSGWEVQGHLTDPDDDPNRQWTLEAVAICLRD